MSSTSPTDAPARPVDISERTIRRAWWTEWGDILSVVPAVTRGQARALTVKSARDANYRTITFTAVKVKRAPVYDSWAADPKTRPGCYGSEYLPRPNES